MAAVTGELDSATELLGAAREQRRISEEAEGNLLQMAAQWAAMHPVESIVHAACLPGTEGEVAISGPGAPLVAEFCIAEFAAALGMSPDAGRRYLGDAVELRYRLPRHFARVVAGDLPAWRARRVAEQTKPLSPEAAAYVDRHLAPFAHSVGPIQLERLVDEAIARFQPALAEERRERAAEQRRFDIDLDHADTTGTVEVTGCLDLADALDLEAAVTATARDLADLGSTDSLDVRRSRAVGEIARRDLTLDLGSPEDRGGRPGRQVVLAVHLTDAALAGRDDVGRCASSRTPVMVEQLREWCGTADRVVVTPVVDLSGHAPVDSCEIPDRHRAQVELREHHCAFPWCTRPVERCDLDHVVAHPRGPTCPCNLAPLCRRHHRHKTHGGWAYTVIDSGSYLWRSPLGYHYIVDHSGTRSTDP